MSKNGINNITLPAYKEAIETVKGMVPGFQTTFAIAISLLINLSGWELTNFKVVDVSTAQYTIKQIVNASDDSVLSEKRAKDYLKAMTGSEYLPKYSYEKPTYTYIIAENVIWKVQYDSEHGLLLYKMIELPTSTGTKLYKHVITNGEDHLVLISTKSTAYGMNELGDRLKGIGSLSPYITDGIFFPFEGFITASLDIMTGKYKVNIIRATVSGSSVTLSSYVSINLDNEATDTVTEL